MLVSAQMSTRELLEELLAQRLFERSQLAADRGLGQVQPLAGSRDGPLAGHGPEVEQVVIIQPFHAGAV